MERVVLANAPSLVIERFEQMPTLRSLGFAGGNDGANDEFVDRLARSKLLPRLVEIGLTPHRYDSSNAKLVEHAAKFEHVKLFARPVHEVGWVHAWHDLAHLYEALGRTSDALAEFDALVTYADDATYWADVGVQLAKLARRDEAMAAHEHAIALQPKCGRAWSGKACLLEDAERFADAIVAWDGAQAAGLADVHTWTHRAWTLMRLDRNDEALVALDAALAIDPKHAWSIENKKQLRSVTRRMRKLFGGMFGR
jgi:tetratricopeptide (TPR) repeat protein